MEHSGTKNCSNLISLVWTAYLVLLDTSGTCLDPRRHLRFHSNHPVWLGLAEACHTTKTVFVKIKAQIFETRITFLCMHPCLCIELCVHICTFMFVLLCVWMCVCVYVSVPIWKDRLNQTHLRLVSWKRT